ncbi:Prenylcysteine lyase domain-containing protein [Madurella fahalii]|uniref:Prenylcysteine lyase domain-containing protein n=1 Tax=Madurella fahalii TaxID=1157608 RepID=A0ABQ0GJK0_9PEZI
MRPSLQLVSAAVAFLSLCSAAAQPDTTVRQVAIIGAGAAGSSAAYHLQDYARRAGIYVNITLFEKTDRIGGRSLTINPYGDPSQRVELGASIFIQKNHILYRALHDFGLSKKIPDEDAEAVLGIWDGDKFVFTINERASFWWNAIKVIWKYGVMAPRRTQKLMQTTIDKFLRMYEEPFFPFRSLTERAQDLGLVEITGVTGQQLLQSNNIDGLYAHDIVQASTRVNYASNLGHIHGLDTMVSMAPEGAMAVQGGNWQIFHKMVEKSGAIVSLNTSVVALDRSERKHGSATRPQYIIRTNSPESEQEGGVVYPVAFDDVVVANPWQFSGIEAAENVMQDPIDEIPYVQLHVTIFSTPYRYDPSFFGLTKWKDVPSTVLTTLPKSDNAIKGDQEAGKAGFFSISILRKAVNPKNGKHEYIYKIFSPRKVTPEFLSRLFGVKVPGDFVGGGYGSECVSPITWYHPHVFHSYPKALPRVTFQDPVIGPGLYYTSGMESFISTMETNALMGKNVARLLIDDILGMTSTDKGSTRIDGLPTDDKQKSQPTGNNDAPDAMRDL